MVEVRLHGDLAKEFGKVWHLNISSPQEAVAAIEANTGKFVRKIKELSDKGMFFRVRSKHHDYSADDLSMNLGSVSRVDIIPVIVGSSAGVRFVIGAALVATSIIFPSPYSPHIFTTGVSLMLGSVVEWLTPMPKKDNVASDKRSWTINGPTDTADQGSPVPVIYGEVLTGAYVVSAGISASDINTVNNDAPSVNISGESHVVFRTGAWAPGTTTIVFVMTADVFELREPLVYTWSFSGFAGSTAVRASATNKPVIRLEVDLSANIFVAQYDLTGSVSVSAQGRTVATETSGTPTTATVTATKALTLTINNAVYDGGGG